MGNTDIKYGEILVQNMGKYLHKVSGNTGKKYGEILA
jgi:hypothetical protein